MRANKALAGMMAATVVMGSTAALAHTGAGAPSGLAAGLGHPLGGLDHVVTTLAVGLWAAQLGGRALWALPASFLAAMALAATAGAGWPVLPLGEAGVLVSMIVVGVAVACRLRLTTFAAAAVVAGCALFHGYVHGTEMAVGTNALAYGLGFTLTTAALHGLGLAVGRLPRAEGPMRLAGGAISLAGVALVL